MKGFPEIIVVIVSNEKMINQIGLLKNKKKGEQLNNIVAITII